MVNNRRGSIFLLALGALVILFILGIALTFFTGSEDWSSGLSYESEVAFNLAESATEEFVARLKNALNHDDPGNMLFKVLRGKNIDPNKEIPLDAAQVANLTGFTRKTAHDIYGFRFGSGMANSSDFEVTASIKLREVNPVKPKDGTFSMFDKKEKQGELTVTSRVNYRGRHAKITLMFLLRVVKTFIPPYNYFTLFIRDGSAFGGSDWNSFDSLTGKQDVYLNLEHGWNDIITNFDATKHVADWEKALTQGQVPPGRVYMGQEPQLGAPATTIQATNGAKMLVDRPTLDQGKALQYNGQDNFWLKFDVPWMLFDDYRKKVTEIQGDQAIKKDFFDGIKGLFTDVFGKDVEIRVINVGAGQELTQDVAFGEPAFVRAVQSYIKFRDLRLRAPGQIPYDVKQIMYPEITKSGLHIFGHAPPPSGNINPYGTADFSKLSPTIVYGQVMRQYNRIVSLRRKPGASNPPYVDPKDPSTPINLEVPFIGTEPTPDGSAPPISVSFDKKSPLTATEAGILFSGFSVQPTYVDILKHNWPNLPSGFREIQYIEKFMSNAGQEPINWGLVNFIQRLGITGGNIPTSRYSGALQDIVSFGAPGFMANHQYPGMPGALSTYVQNSPMRAFYEGDLWYAMPEGGQAYLMDFYFIPRSTEDFFRGRTTISIGGNYYDRFMIKYVKEGTLELSGILALNDPADLVLNNLNFRGRGVIYSSPMMGGGPVSIQGNFFPHQTGDPVHAMERSVRSDSHPDMVTIIAPLIEINTDAASTAKCYVEANLISVLEPIRIKGKKELVIRGTVASPYMNMKNCIQAPTTIKYNSLNAAWTIKPEWYDQMYVAKIVTGGVGKFDWTYVQRQ